MRTTLVTLLLLPCFAASALAGGYLPARISYLDGKAAFAAQGEVDWSAAAINTPLRGGDRLYVAEQGRAEIEWNNGTLVRLGGDSDLEILGSETAALAGRLSLGQAVFRLAPDTSFQLYVPQGNIELAQEGVYRVDVRERGAAELWVRKGRARAQSGTAVVWVKTGERIQLEAGSVLAQTTSRAFDELDFWSDRRDATRVGSVSVYYVTRGVFGGLYDLDRYGRWDYNSRFGNIWFPSVYRGWSPYALGRWLWRSNWGWTWISYEPWGWLPYHYGRWYYDSLYGWGWLPGYASGFSFWSPALVRFFSYNNYVSWCPLGPGDFAQFTTVDNINILNRSPLVSRNRPPSLDRLINRDAPGAVVGMPSDDFARGALPSAPLPFRAPVNGAALEGQPRIDPRPDAFRPGQSVEVPRSPIQVRASDIPATGPSGTGRGQWQTEALPPASPTVTVAPPTPAPAFSREALSSAPQVAAPPPSVAPRVTSVRYPSVAPTGQAPAGLDRPRVHVINPSAPPPIGPSHRTWQSPGPASPSVAPRPIGIPGRSSPASSGRSYEGPPGAPRGSGRPPLTGPRFSAPSSPASAPPPARIERSNPGPRPTVDRSDRGRRPLD